MQVDGRRGEKKNVKKQEKNMLLCACNPSGGTIEVGELTHVAVINPHLSLARERERER